MWRLIHVCAIAAIVGSAVYAYSIKYETIWHVEQVAKIKSLIQKERDAIAVLRAEWAHLTRPERVQALADKHTELGQMSLNQIVRLSELPEKQQKTDTIGRKLELLGLSEPTNTPGETKSVTTTPSTPKR